MPSSSPAPNASKKLLSVLSTVCAPDAPLSPRVIVERSGLTKPSVYRILLDLETSGFVQRHGDGSYEAGPSIRGIAAVLTRDSRTDRTIRVLQKLQAEVGQTVHFAVRSGDHAVYLQKLENNSQGIRIASGPGMTLTLHSTAIGKAILARLPESDVRAYADHPGLVAHTERTVTRLSALLADLAEVRRRGWALDDRENEEHVRCIGAAVTEASGRPIGGISISTVAPLVARDSLMMQGPVLMEAAANLSEVFR